MTRPRKLIRVAVLGLAHAIQHRLVESLSRHPDVELVALWTDSREGGEEVAGRYRIPFDSDLTAILQRTDVEAVAIDVPYPSRAELIGDAARCGKAVLCPQPVAISLEQIEELEAVLAETGAFLLSPSELRCRLPAARARRALTEDVIGPLYSLFCARRRRPPERAPDGGVLLDLGTEALDYLAWCANTPVTRVYAETGTLFQPALSVADSALVHLTFADDSMGLAELAWSLPATYPREDDIEVEVVGERGVVLVSPLNQKVSVHSQRQNRTIWEDWLTPASDGMVEELVRCLSHDEPPRQSVPQARQALRLVLAAYESARTGQPVDLD